LIMRLLTGAGTPREFQARGRAWIGGLVAPDGAMVIVLLVAAEGEAAILVVSFSQTSPPDG
jgi:hypothetical protein